MTTRTATTVKLRRALRIDQGAGAPLYLFSLTAHEILEIAEISRIARGDHGELIGYQRPEVRQHVQEITTYLDGGNALFPNPIIIALPSSVRFTSSRGPNVFDGAATAGMLEIPPVGGAGRKPGWIVDGQQRALALSRAKRQDFPVPVNAFITDSIELQRDQFLRINNTRPLPRGLVTELLPQMSSPLPRKLSKKQLPSAICDSLNTAEDSPFRGLISRASNVGTERKAAVVADKSLVDALSENLGTGCLSVYHLTSGETDSTGVWVTLITYWTAVRDVFPDAWAKPSTRSRLMHGAGIRAMGRLMDWIMPMIDVTQSDAGDAVRAELERIAPYCHWTSGRWEELGMSWNEIQNTTKHINDLSSYLRRVYQQARMGR
jgi:DGQHR domain-containing protein